MLHSNIQKKFQVKPRQQKFAAVTELEWNDFNWQIKNARSGVTPYYENLGLDSLIRARMNKLGFKSSDLMKSDSQIAEDSMEADICEYTFDWMTVLPQRITQELINHLKKDKQVLVHLSINHPDECTQEFLTAVSMLADNGIILNNHMTLFNGINDTPEIVKELNLKLIMMRVRPYTIVLHDVNKDAGVSILESLRGWTSGLAVPHMLIKKEGSGYESVLPDYVRKSEGESFIFRNYKNMDFEYFNS